MVPLRNMSETVYGAEARAQGPVPQGWGHR
jgi:hypothetical protein